MNDKWDVWMERMNDKHLDHLRGEVIRAKQRIEELKSDNELLKEKLLAIEAKIGTPYKSYGINLTELNKEK